MVLLALNLKSVGNEHQHCLFMQQGNVYIKTNPLMKPLNLVLYFMGKILALREKKKECNFVGFSFQEQSEKASVGYYLHKIT